MCEEQLGHPHALGQVFWRLHGPRTKNCGRSSGPFETRGLSIGIRIGPSPRFPRKAQGEAYDEACEGIVSPSS